MEPFTALHSFCNSPFLWNEIKGCERVGNVGDSGRTVKQKHIFRITPKFGELMLQKNTMLEYNIEYIFNE